MLVIAQHRISDPETFWNRAQELIPALPVDLKIHAIYPSPDQKTCTCLWEAPSPDEVQNYLDENLGRVSQNYCYEVNEATAVGLPKRSLEATAF